MEGAQVQLIRPPVAVRSAAERCCRERTLLFVFHVDLDLYFCRVGAAFFFRRRVDASERDRARDFDRQSGQRPQ